MHQCPPRETPALFVALLFDESFLATSLPVRNFDLQLLASLSQQHWDSVVHRLHIRLRVEEDFSSVGETRWQKYAWRIQGGRLALAFGVPPKLGMRPKWSIFLVLGFLSGKKHGSFILKNHIKHPMSRPTMHDVQSVCFEDSGLMQSAQRKMHLHYEKWISSHVRFAEKLNNIWAKGHSLVFLGSEQGPLGTSENTEEAFWVRKCCLCLRCCLCLWRKPQS